MLVLATGCKNKKTTDMENPFIAGFNTPYNIPDFGKIKTEHYMPAFEEGMRQQKAEIDAIVNNAEEPTFENTIEAYEYSGQLLSTVSGVFFNLSECENSPEMEAIAEEVTPKLSAHGDDIALNAKLFARIKAVYEQKDGLGLNPDLDFGAGAYYYADIPDYQKVLNTDTYTAALPFWVYLLLFFAWGWLMWRLWKRLR